VNKIGDIVYVISDKYICTIFLIGYTKLIHKDVKKIIGKIRK